MLFTQTPEMYAAIDQEIRYVVEQEDPGNIDIRVLNDSSKELLGTKRFPDTTQASFDLQPWLHNVLEITPSSGETGFKSSSERTIPLRVEAYETGNDKPVNWSTGVTLIPGDQTASPYEIRTTMPSERLIPAGAGDELTLLTNNACNITITGTSRDSTIAENFQMMKMGLHIFRLDTRDFPECETITVDVENCGAIHYTVIPASQNAARVAWRSHAGSIEHYSFPTVRSTTLHVTKQRAEGIDGHLVTAAETVRETLLVSAYERPEVLEALAEVTSAQQVWLVDGDSYTPIDVLTEEAVIQRHGTLCSLELLIRPKK